MRAIKVKASMSLGSVERLELMFCDDAKKQQSNQEDGSVDYEMAEEFREPIDCLYHSMEEEYLRQVPSDHSDSTAETDNRTGSVGRSMVARTLTFESEMYNFPVEDERNENDATSGYDAITSNRSLSSDEECSNKTATTADAEPSQLDLQLGAEKEANGDIKQLQLEPGEVTSIASSVRWKLIKRFSSRQNKAEHNSTISKGVIDFDEDRVVPQQEQQQQQQQQEEELDQYGEVSSSVIDEVASAAVLSSVEVARTSTSIISEVTTNPQDFVPVYDPYTGGKTISYQAHTQQPHVVGGSTSDDDACRSTAALDGYVESKSKSKRWFNKLRSKIKEEKTQDVNDENECAKLTPKFSSLPDSSKRQKSKLISNPEQSRQLARQERVQNAPPLLDIVARKRDLHSSAQKQDNVTDCQPPPVVDIFARMHTPSQKTPSENRLNSNNLSRLKVGGTARVISRKDSIPNLISTISDIPASSGNINLRQREWNEYEQQGTGRFLSSFLCMFPPQGWESAR
jgi:hypothetical protein